MTLLLSLCVAAAACTSVAPAGAPSGDGAPTVFSATLTAATPSALPDCAPSLAGTTALVGTPAGLWSCTGREWIPIPCLTLGAGAVAYAGKTNTLLACVAGKWTPIALPAGSPGPAGPAGPAGKDGVNGKDGTNGSNGADGHDGRDGASSLIAIAPEPAGDHCAAGGQRIDVGVDRDGDAVLAAGEVQQTAYVCNGSDAGGRSAADGGSPEGGSEGGAVASGARTCEEAAAHATNVGCEFWPTVTANVVDQRFGFAVAVTNPGDTTADVVVTRAGALVAVGSAEPGHELVLTLPWIDELEGFHAGGPYALVSSVRVDQGAYRLLSSRPVVVHQFNAFKGRDGDPTDPASGSGTNEASLLLPTSTLGSRYYVPAAPANTSPAFPTTITLTGVHAGTQVAIDPRSAIVGGSFGVPAVSQGGRLVTSLDEGTVVELVLSQPAGAYIEADHPVQVVAGAQCAFFNSTLCNHLEETVLPVAALGARYAVSRPTGPDGVPIPHVVSLQAADAQAVLVYAPPIAGAPSVIQAGSVVTFWTDKDFVVESQGAVFGVSTFAADTSLSDPPERNDVAQTIVLPVRDWAASYTFATALDDDATFVDVVGPVGTAVRLDGTAVALAGGTQNGFSTARLRLPATGAHHLEASAPVSAQVIGHAPHSSYAYPAGASY